MKDAKLIMHRDGGFDDCAVSGDWLEQQDGTRLWQITIVSADNYRSASERVNLHCLVTGGKVQCLKAGITFPELNPVTGKSFTNVDHEVVKGVLNTISAWENECAGAPGLDSETWETSESARRRRNGR